MAAQPAQTEEFMFQNVASRPTVYKTRAVGTIVISDDESRKNFQITFENKLLKWTYSFSRREGKYDLCSKILLFSVAISVTSFLSKVKCSTARPRDTRPQGVRTLEIHGF